MKRSHKNDKARTTARERAERLCIEFEWDYESSERYEIQRAMQAHARGDGGR